jgi:hypothetical protein
MNTQVFALDEWSNYIYILGYVILLRLWCVEPVFTLKVFILGFSDTYWSMSCTVTGGNNNYMCCFSCCEMIYQNVPLTTAVRSSYVMNEPIITCTLLQVVDLVHYYVIYTNQFCCAQL